MNRKKWKVVFLIEAIICFTLVTMRVDVASIFEQLILFPFNPIAIFLRELSLRGDAFNIVAIILYVSICISPMVYYVRKKRQKEDSILIAFTSFLFIMLYLLINQHYLGEQAEFVKVAMSAILHSITMFYIIQVIVRILNESNTKKLSKYVKGVMLANVAVLVVGLFGVEYSLLLSSFTNDVGVLASFVKFIIAIIQYSLFLTITNCIYQFVKQYFIYENYEAAVRLIHTFSKLCKVTIIVLFLNQIILNIVQIILLTTQTLEVNIDVIFPFFELCGLMIVLLISRIIEENYLLKLESESII